MTCANVENLKYQKNTIRTSNKLYIACLAWSEEKDLSK